MPQDETWTDFVGLSWIQYDLFRKNKLPGSKNINLAKFMLRADEIHLYYNQRYRKKIPDEFSPIIA